MKKVLLAVVTIIFLTIYAVSSSEPLMKTIAQFRYKSDALWGSDKYTFGDLYGLSYLPQFRIRQPASGMISIEKPKSKRDINLYALVDSHVFSFVKSDTVFYGVKNYWFSTWNNYREQEHIKIDVHQKNVLLLEIVEHNALLFADSNYVLNKLLVTSDKAPVAHHIWITHKPLNEKLLNIFDKKIAENLEFNLFNYRLFSPLKELKAALNYRFFDRVDKDVIVSANKKYLFLKETADTSFQSSFHPLPQQHVNQIVTSLNDVYKHYKAIGFDDVYLTIVPNPVSILEPNKRYNQLIARIQNDPRLKINVIDLLDLYKNSNVQVYKNSDTHYTNAGYKLWIQQLNNKLMAEDTLRK